jgi:hypothetical protein
MKEHLLMGEEKSFNEALKEELKLESAKAAKGPPERPQETPWKQFYHDRASQDWALHRLAVWGRRGSQKGLSHSCDMKDCMTESRQGLEKWSSRPFAPLIMNTVAKDNSERLNI